MNTRHCLSGPALLLSGLLLAACAAEPPGGDAGVTPARLSEPAADAILKRSPSQPPPDAATTELAQELALRAAGGMAAAPASSPARWRAPAEPLDRETYAPFEDNAVRRVTEQPVSTLSADVDTAAYANVRRFLLAGRRPPRDAVRVEEMVNYFNYDYPAAAGAPFRPHAEVAPSPWNPDTHLLQVGIRALEVPMEQLPPVNLVFLVDVSGSMRSADKLPLLKQSLRLLLRQLRAEDRVALVVYAGASGLVLEPTPGDRRQTILAALDGLEAGGATNGAAGIRLAYATARRHAGEGILSRVVLATDGDFNVGTVDRRALRELVEDQRRSGVSLSVLGFGGGNYNDALMEELSNHGNGNAAYIDSLKEANKVLARELGGTLHTVAADLKIQVEFNPATVAEYRLIGYENRALRREDFANDQVDAGDIGAGHTMTALYEIRLRGRGGSLLEPLRYSGEAAVPARHGDELALLRLRYKLPGEDRSRLLQQVVPRSAVAERFEQASEGLRFAAAVAGFGQWLRGGRYLGGFEPGGILGIARAARGPDPHGERAEFVQLVELSLALD